MCSIIFLCLIKIVLCIRLIFEHKSYRNGTAPVLKWSVFRNGNTYNNNNAKMTNCRGGDGSCVTDSGNTSIVKKKKNRFNHLKMERSADVVQ